MFKRLFGGSGCSKCPDNLMQTQQIMNNVQDGIVIKAVSDNALLFANEVGRMVIGTKITDFNVKGNRIDG